MRVRSNRWGRVLAEMAAVGATVAAATLAVGSPAGASAATGVRAVCPPATPGTVECQALVRTGTGNTPEQSGSPAGYTARQLEKVYGLSGGVAGHPVVAVADAFGDPHALSDLTTYRATLGLPPVGTCTSDLSASLCFDQVAGNGASHLPPANRSWDQEQSLDLDMVSAACPQCSILLVEAPNTTDGALGQAVNRAVALGAVVVSNSYTGPETTGPEPDYSHAGVAMVASSGDDGYETRAYAPASYPSVVAVGGTSLASIEPRVETAWDGSGSDCSRNYAEPAWQVGVISGCTTRAVADISADANPNTGVAVYDQGWEVYGGTSVSSPLIAGAIARAGNWRDFGTDGALWLYAHASDFFDITAGTNGACGTALCDAGPGWDGPTGLGAPDGLAGL